jgi:type I restriction enzyme R subunit
MKQRSAGDPRIDSELKQSLYDNLGKNVELALSVYKAVVENAKVGFRENKQRKLKVKKAIENVLQNEDPTGELAEKILKIVIASREVQP